MIDLSIYQYTESASGEFTNRKCRHVNSIPRHSHVPEYAQYMRYPKDFQESYHQNNTAKFYSGKKYSPVFPLDIDSNDGNLEKLKADLVAGLINFTLHFEIETSALRIYFSGEKGFHVEVPSILFGIQPSKHLEKYFRKLGDQLTMDFFSPDYVDLRIYSKNRLLRLPNSRHQNSGLYKTPLTFLELCSLSIDEIKEIASEPRTEFESWELSENSPNPMLQKLWRKVVSSKINSHDKKIDEMLSRGVSKGQRHNTAFDICRGLKNDFSNDHEIEQNMIEWNKLNYPKLEIQDIRSTIKSTKPFKAYNPEKDRFSNLMEYFRDDHFFNSLNLGHQACMTYLISRTNEYPKKLNRIDICPGQVVFSLNKIATHIGITIDMARTFLAKAEKAGCLKKQILPDRSATIVQWNGELAEIFVGKNPTLESQSEIHQNPHTSNTEEPLIP